MPNTQTIYLTGKGKWFHKIFQADEYRGKKSWSFTLYPEPDSLEKIKGIIKQYQLLNRIKKDEDGECLNLKRPVMKPWKVENEPPEFEPVRVLDEHGELITDDYPKIGNGTKVTAKLSLFQSANGSGMRLESIRVDELVEYAPPAQTAPEPSQASTGPTKTASARPTKEALPF